MVWSFSIHNEKCIYNFIRKFWRGVFTRENKVRLDLKDTDFEGFSWLRLTQIRLLRGSPMNASMNIQFFGKRRIN